MQPLRIREAQLQILRDAAHVSAVEAALIRHFPDQAAAMTPAALERLILDSRQRALSFGLSMAEVQGFVSFELVFGQRYWETVQFRWARRILEDKDIESPAQRFRRLREAAIFFTAAAEERAERELAANNQALAEAPQTDGELEMAVDSE